MTQQADQLRQRLLEKFRTITMERLVRMNNTFLALDERADNPPLWAELLREVHTAKGEAKMMGLGNITAVAHHTKDLLLIARGQGANISQDISRLVLAGFDIIGNLLTLDPESQAQQVAERFAAEATTLAQAHQARGVPVNSASGQEPLAQTLAGLRLQTRDSLRVDRRLLDELTDLAGDLMLGHGRQETDLRWVTRLLAAWRREMAALKPLLRRLRERTGDTELLSHLDEVEHVTRLLGQLQDENFAQRVRLQALEERVRETRLVPLSTLLSRFPRGARDLAAEQSKRVKVVIEGADVWVDGDVLDQVSEPLLHLMRNCVDHGIEPPEARRRAGKPEEGCITFAAAQRSSLVEIRVSDDGAGMDPKRLYEAAVARALVQPSAPRPQLEELYEMIFRPGFSTHSHATEVSGRGVGLDVVRQQTQALGGSVEMQTTVGQGTTFRLLFPVSMVLGRALVVQVASHYVAVPSEAVHQAMIIEGHTLVPLASGQALRIDEETAVPVYDLAELLRFPTGRRNQQPDADIAVLILAQRGHLRGFIVQGFVGERQVVQRKLDPFCEGLRFLHGTAVLADGDLALMLNVAELLHVTPTQPRSRQATVATTSRRTLRGRVLVVDDSETSRDLLVATLQSQGFAVTEAVNGAVAVGTAERERPDVIITDLEMPIMDGHELLRVLHAHGALAQIPVIVFSSRVDVDSRNRALAAGACAYVVKARGKEQDVLATVERLTGPGHE